jgi:hypothetical protein
MYGFAYQVLGGPSANASGAFLDESAQVGEILFLLARDNVVGDVLKDLGRQHELPLLGP